MSLLLAMLPVEGLGFAVQEQDTCSSCRCCVQTNTNPAPVRNAPPTASKTIRVERAARTEPEPFVVPPARIFENLLAQSDDAELRVPSVALFERHCAFLI